MLENDTLNGTLANAAAKPDDLGDVYTGLAWRTNTTGTEPASMRLAAADTSAYEEIPA